MCCCQLKITIIFYPDALDDMFDTRGHPIFYNDEKFKILKIF